MNKNEFTKLLKDVGNYATLKEAEQATKAFTEAVTTALAGGEDVSLIGFGSFNTKPQKGKSGKVPGTDKTYTTQDKMVPKFKAGKGLKDRVAAIGKQWKN